MEAGGSCDTKITEFLNRVESFVALIYCNFEKENGYPRHEGHGVFIHRSGIIATACHLFLKMTRKGVNFTHKVGDEVVIESLSGKSPGLFYAKITELDELHDIALLKITGSFAKEETKKKFRFNYARLADGICVGHSVYMLVSSDGIKFEFTDGTIAYGNRTYGDIDLVIQDPKDKNATRYFAKDAPLVQAHNLHGIPGCSGAPVFNSRGCLIGIYSFGFGRMDFLVHLSILKAKCGQTQMDSNGRKRAREYNIAEESNEQVEMVPNDA